MQGRASGSGEYSEPRRIFFFAKKKEGRRLFLVMIAVVEGAQEGAERVAEEAGNG